MTQVARRRQRRAPPRIEGPEDLYRLLRPLLAHQDREHFYVVPLSTKHHVLAVELVSVGSLSASLVHPREVFKPAIQHSASAIVVAHNHPSGVAEPSGEDRDFTRRLARAGDVLGIRLLDHLIVCADSYVSLRAEGVIA
jgi:DNA repair protein RadC